MKDIIDIIEEKVQGISTTDRPVHFLFANWRETCEDLAGKGKSKSLESQRYPLVLVHNDYSEDRDFEYKRSEVRGLKIYIITQSKANYTTDQRRDNIYTPILTPIYDDLLSSLKEGRYIQKENDCIQHTLKNLYRLWVGDDSNRLPDFLDAIEITFNSIIYNLKKC